MLAHVLGARRHAPRLTLNHKPLEVLGRELFSTSPFEAAYAWLPEAPALGQGACGTVVEAVRLCDGEHVAVKVMTLPMPHTAQSAYYFEIRFMNEVMLLRRIRERIQHAGDPAAGRALLSYEEAFAATDASGALVRYIVLPLCRGGELIRRVAERGAYSEADAARLMRVLARAVGALHAQHIVHRDIKAENILLRSSERGGEADFDVVLTDYGLARGMDADDAWAPLTVGTLEYLAPEVLAGGLCTPASDVWALGVVLHLLLSGARPFERGGPGGEAGMMARIAAGDAPVAGDAWAAVSAPAVALVRAMLEPDPARRPLPGAVLAHPWLAGAPPTVPLSAAQAGLRRLVLRRRFVASAVAVAWCVPAARRAAAREAAAALPTVTPPALRALRERFRGAGERAALPRAAFVNAMEASGISDRGAAEAVFGLLDSDKDGRVDWREFLLGVTHVHAEGPEKRRRARRA